MTSQLPKEPTAAKVRADAIAILAMGIVAALAVIHLAVQQFQRYFAAEGVIWNLPVEMQTATAHGLTTYGSAGAIATAPVSGTFTHLQVLVTDLNTVSTVCLVLYICFATATAIAAIACVVRLAWLFQQNRFFTMPTSRTLRAFTWIMLSGGIIAFSCYNLAANGVEGALNVQASSRGATEWWAWYWIVLFVVTASGLIDIALRRAMRLQHETEGLV